MRAYDPAMPAEPLTAFDAPERDAWPNAAPTQRAAASDDEEMGNSRCNDAEYEADICQHNKAIPLRVTKILFQEGGQKHNRSCPQRGEVLEVINIIFALLDMSVLGHLIFFRLWLFPNSPIGHVCPLITTQISGRTWD